MKIYRRKSILLILIGIMSVTIVRAQIIKSEECKWPAAPEKIEAAKEFNSASAVLLKDVRIFNYYYDKSKEKDNLALEETLHKIIQINDARAIEVYNRLYIPLASVLDVLDLQARTITADGKITELDKSKIKELENKEGEGAYKIFAFEGLEKGSRLEYYYKVKLDVDFSLRNIVQGSDPVQFHQLEIITPENLKFDYKTYGGKSEVTDTVVDEKRYILLTSRNVVGLDEEKYSTYAAGLMRHEAQLAYNTAVGKSRILSFNSAVQRSYDMLYQIDPKVAKKIEKLSGQLGLSKMDTKEKVRTVENYIKMNIQIEKKRSVELEDLSKILQNKLADNNGVINLYINIFEANGVKCEVVYTTDRTKVPFDPGFESWNYLAENILYFPDIDKYIDPGNIALRYPMISTAYSLNNGLFMEEVTIGKFKSATYSIKKIPASDVSQNGEVIDATCRFNKNMDSVDIKFTRALAGELGAPYRFIFNYLPKEDKKKQLDLMMKFDMADGRVISEDLKNTDFMESEKPLIVSGEVIGGSLIEKTGRDVLFKLGDVIGPQTELYQEKERQTDIDMSFANTQKRTIRLEVPDGYKLSGLDAIKKNIHFDYAGKDAYGFISDYTLVGKLLTITINEYYNMVQLPKSEFPNFRKVINSSADFNKVNVVLEKL